MTDVVIIGCGPVGALAANLLGLTMQPPPVRSGVEGGA